MRGSILWENIEVDFRRGSRQMVEDSLQLLDLSLTSWGWRSNKTLNCLNQRVVAGSQSLVLNQSQINLLQIDTIYFSTWILSLPWNRCICLSWLINPRATFVFEEKVKQNIYCKNVAVVNRKLPFEMAQAYPTDFWSFLAKLDQPVLIIQQKLVCESHKYKVAFHNIRNR